MKLRIIAFCLLLINSNLISAQLVSLKGRVIDKKNNLPVHGVTVKVGMEGVSTDKDGNFIMSVPLNIVTEKGISVSCIGYVSSRLIYEPNHFYEIELVENNTQLKEVVIGAGDDIIKKAIKKIPQNYPDKPIIISGILRAQTWRNASDYFKSDALIKAYIPPYNGNRKTEVSVLQNHIDTIHDKTLKYLRHMSSYNVVDFQDIAHNRFILNKILKKRKFDYWLVGKQVYNTHKVFVINTTLKDTLKVYDKIDATLYIDTASYAFVAANIYIHNWVQRGFLKKKVVNYRVDYEKIDKKWYLAKTHLASTYEYKNESPQSKIDFIRTKIDSVNIQPMPYKDIVQHSDDILLINKPTNKQEWAKNDSLFKKAESDGRMEIVSNLLLDTIKKNNFITNPPNVQVKKSFGKKILDYLNKGNTRSIFGLTKFPFSIHGTFSSVSESVNYGLLVNTNYRAYKNLFIDAQLSSNLWNNKHVKLSEVAFYLSNELIFNKSARNIILTPYLGYDFFTITFQKREINYNNLEGGLRASYEITHRTAFYLSYGLNSASSVRELNGINIAPTHYTIGFGIIIKK